MIENAVVLAAGLGTRMRPVTDTIPKPLVTVHGKTLLDYALDALAAGGVKNSVVNVHYLAEQIEAHVAPRQAPSIKISDERDALLDSGGGVKKAIGLFEPGPFFILNADSFWVEPDTSMIKTMRNQWNSKKMSMLLLVVPLEHAVGFDGKGDFFMDGEGRLSRRGEAESAPYVYAGAIVANSKSFQSISATKFSLNQLFDAAIEEGRLMGCVLQGLWLHVGTPQSISQAEDAIDRYLSTLSK